MATIQNVGTFTLNPSISRTQQPPQIAQWLSSLPVSIYTNANHPVYRWEPMLTDGSTLDAVNVLASTAQTLASMMLDAEIALKKAKK